MRYINGTRLDDRIIRTDWDAGFREGRQYGRGKSGGQVSNVFDSMMQELDYFHLNRLDMWICNQKGGYVTAEKSRKGGKSDTRLLIGGQLGNETM